MQITTFAAAASENKDILSALGIDWFTLSFQIIAFLILVFLLGKFVFPALIKVVDKRQADIESAAKAADEAMQKAQSSEAEIAKMLDEAHKEAAEIVLTAKEEASSMIDAAVGKANEKAATVIAQAQAQLEKDVANAKKELHNQTIELVALATEKVVGKINSKALDEAVIKSALEEVR